MVYGQRTIESGVAMLCGMVALGVVLVVLTGVLVCLVSSNKL